MAVMDRIIHEIKLSEGVNASLSGDGLVTIT